MGYSVRTDRFRYTEWQQNGRIIAQELYDHEHSDLAQRNLAADPAFKTTLETLSRTLAQGRQAAKPSAAS